MLLEALHHCATIEFFAGKLVSARDTIRETLVALNQLRATHRGYFLSGFDADQVSRIAYAFIHWYVGCLSEATTIVEEVLGTVDSIKHPDSRGATLAWVAAFESLTGDAKRALMHAEQAVLCGEQHEDAITYLPFARIVLGRERHRRGDFEAGTAQIKQGLEQVMPSWYPLGRGFLAATLVECGAWERVVAVADEALAESARTGICYNDAEFLRLRGEAFNRLAEIRRDARNRKTAADSLGRALQVARGQGARWLELRVALSISQLGAQAGSTEQDLARQLAKLAGSFPAEEDCVELREARFLAAQYAK
jgi:hypothetical protein